MYSRLVKALQKLGSKCTVAGTQVTGDNIDGVVECIAEHYAGGGGSGSGCLITPIVADRDNIISFRELATGFYTFHGFFTPYFGSDVSMNAPYPVLGMVINDGEISYVQILFPYKNQVQYLEITDNSYTDQKVKLANYGEINVAAFQIACEFMAKAKVGKDCETLSEVLEAVGDRFKVAKLVLNATDSATGKVLTTATLRCPDVEIWADGNYYLPSRAETIKVFAECDGYTSQYIGVVVTPADLAAGEKVLDVALVASTA